MKTKQKQKNDYIWMIDVCKKYTIESGSAWQQFPFYIFLRFV